MKTLEEKTAQKILDDYFENTLGSRLNAKMGSELCVSRILSAIEEIDSCDSDTFEDALAEEYMFWYKVKQIIKVSR